MAADVETQDLARASLRLLGPFGELDAAGLAAPAGEDLSLDDDLAPELPGGDARLLRRRREPPFRYGDAVAAEELLALVLVQVHGGGVYAAPTGRRAAQAAATKIG